MVHVKETSSRLVLTGTRSDLETLSKAYRVRPPEYWRSPKWELYKKTKGEHGWDGYIYPLKVRGTTGVLARGHLDDLRMKAIQYDVSLDESGVLRRPYAGMTIDDVPTDLVKSEYPDYPHQRDIVWKWLQQCMGIGEITVSGGKSRCACMVSAMLKRKLKKLRVLWLVPTERLVKQATEDAKGFLPDWNITQYGGGKRDNTGDLVIATYAIVGRNFAELQEWMGTFNVLLVDECFPAGTVIDSVPIEKVHVGDSVKSLTAFGVRYARVVRTFKSRPSGLVRVTLHNGSRLVCTPGHPILTQRGYVPAFKCRSGDMVSSCINAKKIERPTECPVPRVPERGTARQTREEMASKPVAKTRLSILLQKVRHGLRVKEAKGFSLCVLFRVWKRDCVRNSSARLNHLVSRSEEGILLRGMHDALQSEAELRNNVSHKQDLRVSKNEAVESVETPRSCEQDSRNYAGATPIFSGPWRERTNYSSATVPICGDLCRTGKLLDGTGDQHSRDSGPSERVPSSLLPRGHRCSGGEVVDRSGRRVASISATEAARCMEDPPLEFVRVDRVEILEQSSDGTFGGLCPDGYVYNLEVEGEHNYFANGILVHNCHHAGSPTTSKIIESVPAYFKFGMTDSAKQSDPIKGLEIRGLLGPVLAEVQAGQMVEDGHLARPTILIVDMPSWQNKFSDLPHQAVPNTSAWAYMAETWKKATYLGPSVERDSQGVPILKKGKEVQMTSSHRLEISGMEIDVESRWCLLERVYDRAIIRFKERNEMIYAWAKHFSDAQERTLIVATRTLHVLLLQAGLGQVIDPNLVKILFSEHSTKERDEVFQWLKDTPGSVLISPLVKEGVSIPELTAGIIGDYVGTIDVARQLVGRFIRKKRHRDDNTTKIVWFVDRQVPSYRKGSLELLRQMEKIRGYNFRHPLAGPETLDLGLLYESRDESRS